MPVPAADPTGGADPEALADLAVAVATEAAGRLAVGMDDARRVVATKSSVTDLVTATDHASEELIVDGLRRARPYDAILSEEGALVSGTSGVRWVVDPLDGTVNFHHGLPAFAVSIAAEVGGVTVAGVVADAARGETFRAVRGAGATLDGRPIRCSDKAELATALVGTGFAYDRDRRARQGRVVAGVVPLVADVRRVGAASIDLCWVACGRLDAFFERGLAPWDLAAGALIAAEAGATVGALDDGPPSAAMTVAAGPAIFAPLQALLARLGADEG